jgi:hypothetical protein
MDTVSAGKTLLLREKCKWILAGKSETFRVQLPRLMSQFKGPMALSEAFLEDQE